MLALDPTNAYWARRAALVRTRAASAMLAGGHMAEAVQELGTAHAHLERLYQDNPDDPRLRLALVETLLVSSTISPEKLPGNSPILMCQKAYDMLHGDGDVSTDYQTLDPWVRVNVCLQRPEPARLAAQRLQSIGYRETAYLHFMASR